jgi:predicted GNAT superfamily acetyltransferase
MSLEISVVQEEQLPLIERLNNQAVPNVNVVDLPKLRWFQRVAPYFRVVTLNSKLAGFLIAIADNIDYDSVYFRWFTQRYQDFLYIDRIVVAGWAQRQGVGLALYQDVEQFAASLPANLVTDVYSMPANEASLAFHHHFGFQLIGTQEIDHGAKTVAKFFRQPSQGDPLL